MKKYFGFIILLSVSLSTYAAPVRYNWVGTISDVMGSIEDATGSFVLADPTVLILDEPNAQGLCPGSTLGCYRSSVAMTDFSLVSDRYSLTGTGSFSLTWASETSKGASFDWSGSLWMDKGDNYYTDCGCGGVSWDAGSPYDLPSTTGGWSLYRNAYSYPQIRIDYAVAVVPLPAAVWLFGSGMLGLIGISRRKKAV